MELVIRHRQLSRVRYAFGIRMTKHKLKFEAELFRGALEDYFVSHPKVNFGTNWMATTQRKFPADHCKATSFAFGSYLINKHGIKQKELYYVWGTRIGETHGWLRYRNFFVDLTGDQFSDQNRATIVVEKNRSSWHKSFLNQKEFAFELAEDSPIRSLAEKISLKISNRLTIHPS